MFGRRKWYFYSSVKLIRLSRCQQRQRRTYIPCHWSAISEQACGQLWAYGALSGVQALRSFGGACKCHLSMSSAHWNSQYQSSSSNGPAQLRKSRPGSKGHSRMASSDNTAPQRHGRSHSFFSFSSKKSAQEQAQQAMETVLESQPPQGQGQHVSAVATCQSRVPYSPEVGTHTEAFGCTDTCQAPVIGRCTFHGYKSYYPTRNQVGSRSCFGPCSQGLLLWSTDSAD